MMTEGRALKTCRKCQERHQKCDNDRPRCGACERGGQTCIRDVTKIKFKTGSSAQYEAKFSKDQIWVKSPKLSRIRYIDETLEVQNYYSSRDDEAASESDAYQHTESGHDTPPTQHTSSRTNWPIDRDPRLHVENLVQEIGQDFQAVSPFDELGSINETSRATWSLSSGLANFGHLESGNSIAIDRIEISPSTRPSQAVEAEYRRLADTAAAAIPNVESGLLSPEVWRKQFFWPNSWTTTQCACLMRYYIEELAPWFDVGDPARHFTLIVPQMARRCPPLLNAIFTAAARHLSLTSKYKVADGHIEFHGVVLRNLTSETALRYHNACLAYLIELSTDPEHVQDEDLLAAVTILQYYEELDSWLTGNNPEEVLNPFRLFIDAQAKAPHPPLLHRSHEHDIYYRMPHVSSVAFRRASLRVALRHDIIAAFVRQRPVGLPLELWASFRSFEHAEDSVWTDRLALYCADVLGFSFGSEQQTERFSQLKNIEQRWEIQLPPSFGAIHYEEANRQDGFVFPRIWYLSEYHAVGMQYLDLAQILLAVYDPNIPRLGHGASAAHARMIAAVRSIMLRICGIAVSNQPSQATLVLAAVAVSVCGEYFTDRQEQAGVLRMLEELENKYAWRTFRTIQDMKQAWS